MNRYAMRLAALLLALVVGEAWGATWYVCDAGQGAMDGTSAANCFDGYADAWANAADIDAGDTLYVVGDILASPTQTIGDSGTAGNPIVIDCLPPGQTTKSVVTTSATGPVFLIDDKQYITVQNCDFKGNPENANQTYSLRAVTRTATLTGLRFYRNRFTNPYATSAVVHGCLVTENSASNRWADVIVEDNEFYQCGIGAPTQNSDGATLNAVSSGLVVRDNIAWGNNADGIDIPGGGAIIVERNLTYGNGFDGIKFHCGSTAISGGRISANVSFGNAVYAYTMQDFANTEVSNNIAIQNLTTIAPFGGTANLNSVIVQAVNTGTCTQSGNVFANNHFQGENANGVVRVASVARAAFEAGNTWNANNTRQMGAGSTVIDFTTDSANNVTVSNFPTWQGSHAKDVRVDPQWVGGSNPTTLQGFRLKPTSPLACAGTDVGRRTDALGRGFEPGCTPIGAMVYGRGDARGTALPARP